MTSSYPEPPSHSEAHYTPIYSANPAVQGQIGQGQPRAPYVQDAPFPKIEDVLQAHALHANHALNDQRVPAQQLPPLAQPQQQHQQQQQLQQQKPNRLRKACDSCSIRKVKVGSTPRFIARNTDLDSAMKPVHRVELV
jgi:hypothetical protein